MRYIFISRKKNVYTPTQWCGLVRLLVSHQVDVNNVFMNFEFFIKNSAVVKVFEEIADAQRFHDHNSYEVFPLEADIVN